MINKKIVFNLLPYQERRRDLRKKQTEPEQRFWQVVRARQLGVKFRRQQGIGHYIVDFYCPELGLVIEIDGDSHFQVDAQIADKKRDKYLNSLGIQIMRFTNAEVMKNLEGVLANIKAYITLRS